MKKMILNIMLLLTVDWLIPKAPPPPPDIDLYEGPRWYINEKCPSDFPNHKKSVAPSYETPKLH